MTDYKVEVCKVKDVQYHPNGDRLDLVTVKGWTCITGRNDFKVGDLVVFVPPDSIATEEFIEKFNITYLKGKSSQRRIGTIKLRDEWSEGLIVPAEDGWKEGDNVTDYYGFVKWEPQVQTPQTSSRKQRRGERHMKRLAKRYSKFMPKYTDIENIRNYPDELEPGEKVWVTEKVHGTNFRAGMLPVQGNRLQKLWYRLRGKTHTLVVGSRNVIYTDPSSPTYYRENIYGWVAEAYKLSKLLPPGYIVYGEIYGVTLSGGAVQKNYSYGAKKPEVVFFDVMVDGKYLNLESAYSFLMNKNLPTAPIVDLVEWDINILKEYFDETSSLDSKTVREGVVIKPIVERLNKHGNRTIFKAISPEYLAQKERTEGH